MGVYLPNVDMPKNYKVVTIEICPDGSIWQQYRGTVPKAKAISVPPHGRLIDENELWVEINKICDRRDAGIITDLTCVQQILSAVRQANIIIPADKEADT